MKLLPDNPLGRFFLLGLLWLPVWFSVWYAMAPLLSAPSTWLASLVLNVFHPGLINDIERSGNIATFVTGLQITVPGGPEGAIGQVVLDKNPLIYSWNLPVLVALLFATGERLLSFNKLLLVYLLLLPFHAWGVGFDLLKTLTLDTGAEIAGQLGYSGWSLEFIGLAYQFGYLMLPVIGATSIWVAMNRELIESMLRPAPGKEARGGVS